MHVGFLLTANSPSFNNKPTDHIFKNFTASGIVINRQSAPKARKNLFSFVTECCMQNLIFEG